MAREPKFDNSLDFEFTDLGDARKVLDELPAGIGAMQKQDPNYWLTRRKEPSAADRALTGPTMHWLIRLPMALQPRLTCDRYPRIVNRIAEAAHDPVEVARVIESLLQDRRGGRAGLPPPVRDELQRLAAHFAR